MTTPAKPRKNTAPPAELDFEAAVQQVEAIIDRIESGEVGLERSIAEYERGVALLRQAREVLARSEQRVQELTSQMQAELSATNPNPSNRAHAAPADEDPSDTEVPR